MTIEVRHSFNIMNMRTTHTFTLSPPYSLDTIKKNTFKLFLEIMNSAVQKSTFEYFLEIARMYPLQERENCTSELVVLSLNNEEISSDEDLEDMIETAKRTGQLVNLSCRINGHEGFSPSSVSIKYEDLTTEPFFGVC